MGTTVPSAILRRYAILRRAQRPSDRLDLATVSTELSVSRLIVSGERLLGRGPSGERIYLVPAQHVLGFRLAPLRCLPAGQRMLERQLAPDLRRQYRRAAVCVIVVTADGDKPSCSASSKNSEALLTTTGASFGLVPDGVSGVSLRYPVAPPRTLRVRHNFYIDRVQSQSREACGLEWLDRTGTVLDTVLGCSYLMPEARALIEYRGYVSGELATLKSQIAALATAIGTGNLSSAESAWLSAHQTWLQIGQDDGAYGCFGDLGGEIDGLSGGLPLGTADPNFTGFHRIELDLWTNHDLNAAAGDTQTLQQLLDKLMAAPLNSYLPATPTGIASWVLRPHEVLEDADRDTLTANDDYGSGTGLASLSADVDAVRVMLSELEPTLEPLAPHMIEAAGGELDALDNAIDATRVNGTWVSVEDLPVRQRQQVDADLGAALETLAPLPDVLTSTGRGSPLT